MPQLAPGYWPGHRLVVEYRELQHDQEMPRFDKPDRMTVSSVHRGEQRALYDARRDTEIPGHGVRLVVIRPADRRGHRLRAAAAPHDDRGTAHTVRVLSVLAAWKVVDVEIKRLAERAAATAGSYGASYEQLGAVWGITRQGARKKWPDAVSRPAPAAAGRRRLALFGGAAELVRSPSGDWRWTAKGADGASGTVADGTLYTTAEEAAAHAGAFLKEHALDIGLELLSWVICGPRRHAPAAGRSFAPVSSKPPLSSFTA